MKKVFTILALLLVTSSFNFGQAKPNIEKHPVETFFLAGIAAFNAHDLDNFIKQFAEDVEMYTPTGWLRGQASVRQRFTQTFQQFPNVKMEIEDLKVREVVSGTVVVTDFKWRVFPMGSGPAFHGVGSGVYVKRKGKWVEVLEHETVTKVDEGLNPSRSAIFYTSDEQRVIAEDTIADVDASGLWPGMSLPK